MGSPGRSWGVKADPLPPCLFKPQALAVHHLPRSWGEAAKAISCPPPVCTPFQKHKHDQFSFPSHQVVSSPTAPLAWQS